MEYSEVNMELEGFFNDRTEETNPPEEELTRRQARSLYFSHTLSTWNARTYEAAAVLFTAAAWPDTLLMSSLRGLFTTLAVLITSSYIGAAIDRSGQRLSPLLYSITLGRISIVLACFGWLLLLSESPTLNLSESIRILIFVFVVLSGIMERLTAIANTITMERDWVPVLATDNDQSVDVIYTLTKLNAVMRRIDLCCKLFSPLLISLIIVWTSNTVGVLLVLGMNSISLVLEWASAKYVWNTNPRLHFKEIRSKTEASNTISGLLPKRVLALLKQQVSQLKDYFSNDVWIPSMALSLLHLSALSYAATFITFLLASGFSLLVVTIARAIGSIVEVSSTFAVPYGVQQLSHVHESAKEETTQRQQLLSEEEEDGVIVVEHIAGVARGGLWGLSLQLACLVPVIWVIFHIPFNGTSERSYHPILLPKQLSSLARADTPSGLSLLAALTMFGFLSVSRLGLWAFDLTTQELTQSLVAPAQRSSFAGSEMSFVASFELVQWIAAAILNSPAQFRWLALGSGVAVAISSAMYAFWVRKRRGHLIHWDNLNSECCKVK